MSVLFYERVFLLLVLTIVLASCVPGALAVDVTCESPPLVNDMCGFYSRCIEAHFPCGDDGYALGYGMKYCQRFSQYEGCDDDDWKSWVNSTLVCLQRSLVPVYDADCSSLSCNGIKSTAFDSHPTCYTGGGDVAPVDPSICFLPIKDQACVLKIIDPKDLIHPADIKQELATAEICVKQLAHSGLCNHLGDRVSDNCRYWRDRVSNTTATVTAMAGTQGL